MSVQKVTLPSGQVRYRFVVDVTPTDPRTRKRLGPRQQERRSYETVAEAEAELERITREVQECSYVPRNAKSVPLRRWADKAGRILAADLFDSGECSPNCLFGRNERYLKYHGCMCPCGGRYHGLLADVTIPAARAGRVS